MNIVVSKIIECFEATNIAYTVTDSALISDTIKLQVTPTVHAAHPTKFRMEFPLSIEHGEALFPLILQLFVLGRDYDTKSLSERAAPSNRAGLPYKEQIGVWLYETHSTGDSWVVCYSK